MPRTCILIVLVTSLLTGCASADKVITREEKYADGNLKSKIEYRIREGEEVLWGKATYYFPNSTVEVQCEHANGKKHGRYEAFYANGARKSAGAYAYGKRDGQWSEWGEDGTERKTLYKDGAEVKPP